MAVYKIFPEKDSTIYSQYPNKNTGLDEILEASTYLDTSGNPHVSRFLIQFPQSEITNIFNTYITTEGLTWSASLKCFLAYASGLNSDTTMEIYPTSGSWNMGTGRYVYNPEYTNGVGWYSRLSSASGNWSTSGFADYVTASFSSSIAGGGTWYTGSSNSTVLPIYTTQSFSFYDDKDINADITNIIKAWVSGTFDNNGVIVKQQTEFIKNSNYQTKLQYFSRDTHTIYPPCLELKWDDYSFSTGSLTELDILPATIAIDNNPGTFYPSSINKFRVNSTPEYPARTFQTSSYYTLNYYLPTASYYAIKDLDTNEYVVDFDDQFTKLSVDPSGSYFTLYMNGLEPERYYSILIKTIINGNTLIFDDNYYFKVING
jgi:hypothetical protein